MSEYSFPLKEMVLHANRGEYLEPVRFRSGPRDSWCKVLEIERFIRWLLSGFGLLESTIEKCLRVSIENWRKAQYFNKSFPTSCVIRVSLFDLNREQPPLGEMRRVVRLVFPEVRNSFDTLFNQMMAINGFDNIGFIEGRGGVRIQRGAGVVDSKKIEEEQKQKMKLQVTKDIEEIRKELHIEPNDNKKVFLTLPECPILFEVFSDPNYKGKPVLFAEDGFTYDESALKECFKTEPNKSPLSGDVYKQATLLPNPIAKEKNPICAITGHNFVQPFYCKEDQWSYDLEALLVYVEKSFARGDTVISPHSHQAFKELHFNPNRSLKDGSADMPRAFSLNKSNYVSVIKELREKYFPEKQLNQKEVV